jgi:hypothetical protein
MVQGTVIELPFIFHVCVIETSQIHSTFMNASAEKSITLLISAEIKNTKLAHIKE